MTGRKRRPCTARREIPVSRKLAISVRAGCCNGDRFFCNTKNQSEGSKWLGALRVLIKTNTGGLSVNVSLRIVPSQRNIDAAMIQTGPNADGVIIAFVNCDELHRYRVNTKLSSLLKKTTRAVRLRSGVNKKNG